MRLLDARRLGLACAAVAVTAGMVVAGCAEQVPGTPTPPPPAVAPDHTPGAPASAAAPARRRHPPPP
ncbi:hypothetical protein ACFWPJ_24175, partial [Nocardia sp. NPDC058497]